MSHAKKLAQGLQSAIQPSKILVGVGDSKAVPLNTTSQKSEGTK